MAGGLPLTLLLLPGKYMAFLACVMKNLPGAAIQVTCIILFSFKSTVPFPFTQTSFPRFHPFTITLPFDLYRILSRCADAILLHNIIWWYIYTINDNRLKQHPCTLFQQHRVRSYRSKRQSQPILIYRWEIMPLTSCRFDKWFSAADLIAKCLRIAGDSIGSTCRETAQRRLVTTSLTKLRTAPCCVAVNYYVSKPPRRGEERSVRALSRLYTRDY